MKPRLPAALLIGLVFGWAGTLARSWSSIAMEFKRGGDDYPDFEQVMRWDMFGYAAGIAGSLLVVGAMFQLAKRLAGVHRVLFLVATWIFVVSLVFDVGWSFIDMLEPGESYRKLLDYAWRSFGALNLGAMIVISIGARAWSRSAPTILAAVGGIIVSMFGAWTPYFGPWMFDSLYDDHRILLDLYWVVREAVSAGALLVMVHAMMRDTAPPLPDLRLGARSFSLAGGALIGRVLAAVALALMGIGMVKSPSAVKLMLTIAPSIAVVTTLVFAAGLVAVDGANLGVPRVRLLLGAAISAWSAAIQLLQTARLREEFFRDSAQHWTALGPVFGAVGIVLVMSAVHGFAITRGNEKLRTAAAGRLSLYVAMSLISICLSLLALYAGDPGGVVLMAVGAAVCGIVALVAVAGLLSLAADAIGAGPELPEARIHK